MIDDIRMTVDVRERSNQAGSFVLAVRFEYPDRDDRMKAAVLPGRGRDLKEMLVDFESEARARMGVFANMIEECVHRLNRRGEAFRGEHRPQIAELTGRPADTAAQAGPADRLPPAPPPDTTFPKLTSDLKQQDLIEIAIAEQADLPQIKANTPKDVIRRCILDNRERLKARAAESPQKDPF